VVEEFANQLRSRSQYLAYEEQREYKRGKVLNVLGGGPAMMSNTDADAFCSRVLEQHVHEHVAQPSLNPELTPQVQQQQQHVEATATDSDFLDGNKRRRQGTSQRRVLMQV
jgi:hypothetical protein